MTGFDAATVEACARIAEGRADMAQLQEQAYGYAKRASMASSIAAAIRALPVAPTPAVEDAELDERGPAVYIAARFSRRPEANALAQELQRRGCVITSRWVKPDCDSCSYDAPNLIALPGGVYGAPRATFPVVKK